MNTIRLALLAFLAIGVLAVIGCSNSTEESSYSGPYTYDTTHPNDGYDITQPYDYPVRPGTPEWASFTSHAEMVSACQIPEAILDRMSTAALVESVLDYPLLGDMMAYNLYQMGFDQVSAQFNGLQELLQRKDAASHLVAKYASMDPAMVDAVVDEIVLDVDKMSLDWDLSLMELILAQEEILGGLTNDDEHLLISETQAKIEAKKEHPDVYGFRGLSFTSVVAGRLLQTVEAPGFAEKINSNTDLKNFLTEISHASPEVLSIIEEQLDWYLDGVEPKE